MRHLIAGRLVFAVWLLTILQVSCLPDDVCGEGYQYKDDSCYKIDDTKKKADASSSVEDAKTDQEDGGDNSEETAVTGLGDSCAVQADCEGNDADYCIINPQTGEGVCTIQGCTDAEGSCPGQYRCCKLPESFGGALCFTPDKYETADSMGMCGN